jgi:Mce-associated membrane protein
MRGAQGNVQRIAVVVVAVLALVAGAVGWWQYVDLTSGPAGDNAALVDEKATAEVQSQVAVALERVLTYDHADPTPTEESAKALLAGKARSEYETLFAALQKQAPGQKLVLTAKVSAAGVTELEGDRASLLVYVDQSSRRAGEDQANVSAAQLAVTARKSDSGSWQVTSLRPL